MKKKRKVHGESREETNVENMQLLCFYIYRRKMLEKR
jgi:hypothetical protein